MANYKLDIDSIPQKAPVVIEGFPGFGLVGTIVTEFLIDHLKCEKIGRFYFESMPSTVAIHKNQLIDPITVYYNKQNNIILIHSITAPIGVEWSAADAVAEICEKLNASHVISIEGVSSTSASKNMQVLYYAVDKKMEEKFKAAKIERLSEGIIVGVTSALLLKSKVPMSCIFAESQSNLPDAKAAAKVIEVLDKVLNLKVNPKPLLKQAEEFEKKLKTLLEQAKNMQKDREEKPRLGYVG